MKNTTSELEMLIDDYRFAEKGTLEYSMLLAFLELKEYRKKENIIIE